MKEAVPVLTSTLRRRPSARPSGPPVPQIVSAVGARSASSTKMDGRGVNPTFMDSSRDIMNLAGAVLTISRTAGPTIIVTFERKTVPAALDTTFGITRRYHPARLVIHPVVRARNAVLELFV